MNTNLNFLHADADLFCVFFSKKLINQSRVGFADFGSHQNASLWRNINVHKPLTHPPRAAVFILLVSLFILFLLRTFIIIQKSFSFFFFFGCSASVKRREMPQDTTSEQDPDDSDAEFVEIDPSARYGRVSFFFFNFYEIYHFHEEDHRYFLVYNLGLFYRHCA